MQIERKSTTSSEEEQDKFTVSQDLIESPNHKAAGTTQLTFDGLLDPPLKLHEDLSEGCGGQLWPAGMVLAKYLLRRFPASQFADKSMFVRFAGCLREYMGC